MQAPVRSLDARYYTDPAIFEVEKAGVLSRTWQFAAMRASLENPGDYVAFDLAGESLFSIMGRDGVIRTFYNVCQHRAHQLLQGAGTTRVVVCPYHAWTYELTGRLRAAPNTQIVAGFDRSSICLTEVRTEVFLGFVFVNLDPDATPMDDWFPGARAELEQFMPHWADLKPLEWVEIPENCNWKVSVENYSECYHCTLNHPTFATGVIKPETYDIQPQGLLPAPHDGMPSLDQLTYDIDSGFPTTTGIRAGFSGRCFPFRSIRATC
jgi:phenylpropionate dioxygenase-like ring-hydroxylating dioxygenase large terminal subunit